MVKFQDLVCKVSLAKEGHEDEWLTSAKWEYADMMSTMLSEKINNKFKQLATLQAKDEKTSGDAEKIEALKVDIEDLKATREKAHDLAKETWDAHEAFIAATGDTVRNLLRLSVAYSNRNLLGYVLPRQDGGAAMDMFVSLVNIHSAGKAGEEGQNLSTIEEYAQARRKVVEYYRPFFDFTADSDLVEKVRVKKVAKADNIKGIDGSFMFYLHEQFIRGVRTTVKGSKPTMAIKPVKDQNLGFVTAFDMSRFNAIVCDLMYRVIF